MKPVTEYKPGDTIEGYRVMRLMGEGAASLIYVVHDPKTMEIWAVKHVEKHEHKDSRFLDQAVLEYDVASRLDHRNIRKIVRLIKRKKLLAVTDVFLVMEFVDGISMEKEPPRDDLILALDIFVQVADALKHMHERGFVHADMKPNNVVICDNHLAKIIDLGQSCPMGTVKPRIQGTPDYIAPEQVHRRPITAKTDIYNLGATLYWVLAGQNIPTALDTNPDALVSKRDAATLERAKPLTQFNPAIPPRLNELIMSCVEPDESHRPANMQAVCDQLALIRDILKTRAGQNPSGGSSVAGVSPGGSQAGGSGVGMKAKEGSRAGINAAR